MFHRRLSQPFIVQCDCGALPEYQEPSPEVFASSTWLERRLSLPAHHCHEHLHNDGSYHQRSQPPAIPPSISSPYWSWINKPLPPSPTPSQWSSTLKVTPSSSPKSPSWASGDTTATANSPPHIRTGNSRRKVLRRRHHHDLVYLSADPRDRRSLVQRLQLLVITFRHFWDTYVSFDVPLSEIRDHLGEHPLSPSTKSSLAS